MIQQFEQLKAMVKDQQTSLTLLISKVDHLMRSTGATSGATELPDDVRFPIKSMQELDIFEEQLRDSQLKHLVVIHFFRMIYSIHIYRVIYIKDHYHMTANCQIETRLGWKNSRIRKGGIRR